MLPFKIVLFPRCPSEAEEDDEAGAFSDTAVAQVQGFVAGNGTRQRRRSVPPSTVYISTIYLSVEVIA